ncbi:tyrosine-type recombinase/integrase [Novosphingobium aquae]|uniref:Tyrosine-type recombinase/integrase n=1 Tax=Novosphingobium aquae TaxID=3133435 RepID=A0ABU8S3W9_9SPHN
MNPRAVQTKALPFTYDALVASFYRTPRWQAMSPSSQKTYRGIIERFRASNGTKDVRGIKTAAIESKLAAMASTPAAANNLRKVLARLHRHAIKLGWRTDNPVTATDGFRTGDGHHAWTEDEIALYEARWPLGTRERLAMALLLYTALRRSDMIRLSRQHRVVVNGQPVFLIGQVKKASTSGGKPISIPVIPQLLEAIDAVETTGIGTYLVTERGTPYKTGDSFGNWFRRKSRKAGLTNCSPHGLRKAMARRLVESGATQDEGRALTDQSREIFAHYSKSADQARLSNTAAGKLVANLSEVRQIKDD